MGDSVVSSPGTGNHALKKILVATDLSARSDRAIERAVTLAEDREAELTVLHVVDGELPPSVRDQVLAAAKAEVSDGIARLGGNVGTSVRIDIRTGKDYKSILKSAREARADAIVLGLHRNEDGLKPVTGTTVERVIRFGDFPVLVVRDRPAAGYRKVLVAADFSVHSGAAIRAALAFAPNAAFHFLHACHVPFQGFLRDPEIRGEVVEEQEEALRQLVLKELNHWIAPFEGDGDASYERIVRYGDPAPVLRREIERLQPDLLVMGTHGRTGIAHAVLGSLAETFLTKPPCDMLVAKAW